jgi:hypothetical protein
MADKRPYEEALAVAVHQAERAVGEALAAPGGANRIEKINATQDALIKAEQRYQHCLSGQAKMIPVER